MNHNIKKSLMYSTVIFIALFLFRLIYGYVNPAGYSRVERFNNLQLAESETSYKVNIASKKFKYQTMQGQTVNVDQKYEKIAAIESKTSDIEKDEKKIRSLVEQTQSVVQFENTSGLKTSKNRIINFTIGVPPEKFDAFVEEIKNIGKITSVNIDKRDKTNEYKELQSKKESLLKIRASLIALKNKGGKIDEYINLENRILEIEEKIQKLGLSLGEFDSENEFCTVKVKISESSSTKIGFLHRIKVAFEWAVKYFLLLGIGFLIFVSAIHFAMKLISKYPGFNLFIHKKTNTKNGKSR